MRAWLTLILAFLFASAPLFAQPQRRPSPVRYTQPLIAITHVTVVDGTGTPARRDQNVVIRAGRIAAVGPAARTPVPASNCAPCRSRSGGTGRQPNTVS